MIRIQLTPKVEEDLRAAGLLGRLQDIVRLAAPVTHPLGNRRYHHFIIDLSVEGGTHVVKSVVDTRKLQRLDEFVAFEAHEACSGSGCPGCVEGLIRVVRRSAG